MIHPVTGGPKHMRGFDGQSPWTMKDRLHINGVKEVKSRDRRSRSSKPSGITNHGLLNCSSKIYLMSTEFVELSNVETLEPVQMEAPDVTQYMDMEVNMDVTVMNSCSSVPSGRSQTTEEISLVDTPVEVSQIITSDWTNGRSQASRWNWKKTNAAVQNRDVIDNLSQETPEVTQDSSLVTVSILIWLLLLTCLYPSLKGQRTPYDDDPRSVEPWHYTVMSVREKKPPDPDTVQGAEMLNAAVVVTTYDVLQLTAMPTTSLHTQLQIESQLPTLHTVAHISPYAVSCIYY